MYDSLKRLVTATSTISGAANWTDNYVYDGFGNLTTMNPTVGSAPTLNVSADWQTNHIIGVPYDMYGNVLTFQSINLGYDVANRLVSVNSAPVYAYDQGNHRVYSRLSGVDTFYLYGMGGQKLSTYTASVSNTAITLTFQSANVRFAGKMLTAENNPVATDALGSVRWSGAGGSTPHAYYPYGAEYTGTGNDTEKYATYTRDNLTGLDYAMNRYYSSQWGRFMSADPSWVSVDLLNPQSWNRYSYVTGDPSNAIDPTGLDIFDMGIADLSYLFAGSDIGSYYQTTSSFGETMYVGDTLPCSPTCNYPVQPSVDVALNPTAQSVLGQVGEETQGLPGLMATGTGGAMLGVVAIPTAIAAAGIATGIEVGSTVGALTGVSASGVSQEVLNTFTNGEANWYTFEIDTTVSRVFDNVNSFANGQYWTTDSITSSSQATETLSLSPVFNQANNLVTGVIRAGTTVLSGTAASNFGQPGGGSQIIIPNIPCISITCVVVPFR